MYASSLLVLLASASLIDGRSVFESRHFDSRLLHSESRHLHHLTHKRASHAVEDLLEARELVGLQERQNGDASATTLAANAIQTGSFVDGTTQIGANVANQAPSLTSQNNFINNCAGKTLTNGLQITTGSCNGITMGDIPAKTAMVSSIITFPLAGSATIESDTTFNITVQMANLVAGSFTNADATYYAAPQALSGGKIVGHTHVTVQDMGASLNPTTPLDATRFAFFKGINDAGNGQGLLTATVTGGLPAGNYRVCTLASASNHQPVLMPVAQRGTADDCTKFTVIGTGTTENIAANDGSKGIAAAALAASAVAAGPGFVVTSTASAVAADVSSSSSKAAAATKATTTKAGNGKNADTSSAVGSSSSKAASTTKAVKGATVSSSVSEASTTTNAGKGAKASSSSATKAIATSKNGGKGKAVVSSSLSFANTTFAATTKASVASSSVSIASVSAVATASSKGGKGKSVTKVFVKKVVVIETFFEFALALGGLCPSVAKNNNQFQVLEELFSDLNSAAAAACGQQFTACVKFSGNGFSVEECTTQKDSCAAVASTAKASSTAVKVTGTATVDATASVTGSVISVQTVTTTVSVAATSAATQAAVTTAAVEAVATSESVCSIVTSTLFVDEPATTAVAQVAAVQTASTCAIVTSTIFVDEPATTAVAQVADATSCSSLPPTTVTVQPVAANVDVAAASGTASAASTVPTADASALGGIAAPAISNSGDATRPFLVNGNTFVNKAAAVQRSCDIQFNACANAFNGGKAVGFSIADCQTQEDDCLNASS